MLKEFQRREDVEKVKAFDWQTTIRGNLPFGGINNVRESKLPPKEVLQRTARLTVSQDSRGEWVRRRLMEEDWGECEVSEVGKPFGGVRTLRIVLPSYALLSDFITQGFRLANERLSPVPWLMHQATRLCNNCWKRHDSKGKCKEKRKCRLCSGDCRPNECKSKTRKCPNCSLRHAATNVLCRYKQALMRKFSNRSCLPLPLFVESASKVSRVPPPVNVQHPSPVNGRSFTSVSRLNLPPPGANTRPRANAQPARQSALAPTHAPPAQQGIHHNGQAHASLNELSFQQILEATLSKTLAPVIASLSELAGKVDSLQKRIDESSNRSAKPHQRKAAGSPHNPDRSKAQVGAEAQGQPKAPVASARSGSLNAELFAELLKGALSPLQHGVETLTTSLDRMENRFNNG